MGQESDDVVDIPVENIVELRRLFFERLDRDGHNIQGETLPWTSTVKVRLGDLH